jgi:hypothetical protein
MLRWGVREWAMDTRTVTAQSLNGRSCGQLGCGWAGGGGASTQQALGDHHDLAMTQPRLWAYLIPHTNANVLASPPALDVRCRAAGLLLP